MDPFLDNALPEASENMDDVLDVLRECEEMRSGIKVGEPEPPPAAVVPVLVGMFGHVDDREMRGVCPTSMGSARRRRRSSRRWSARAIARG
jgi:hypothetical protein